MITQEAKIDSNVFYRRYNNINELFALLVKRYDNWLNDLVSTEDLESLGDRQFLITALKRGYIELSSNRVLQKLMVWELSENNEVTRHTTTMRDKSMQIFIKHFTDASRGKGVDMRSAISILIVAVYYTALYRGSLNVTAVGISNSAFTDKEILSSIEMMVNLLFDRLERADRIKRCITSMLKDGIAVENIQRYLEISPAEYEFIMA